MSKRKRSADNSEEEWKAFHAEWGREDAVALRQRLTQGSKVIENPKLAAIIRLVDTQRLVLNVTEGTADPSGFPLEIPAANRQKAKRKTLDARRVLERELGEWLYERIAKREHLVLSKLVEMLKSYPDVGEHFNFGLGFPPYSTERLEAKSDRKLGNRNASTFLSHVLWCYEVCRHELVHSEGRRLPTKKELRKYCGIDGNSDAEMKKFQRAIKKLGLNGLPEER